MDMKVEGLDVSVLREALTQARVGRLHILGEMNKALAEARADLSPYAPRIVTVNISPEKIGDLIGPKGKTIRGIQEETGAEITVDDTGLVTIAAVGGEAMERARQMVRAITADLSDKDMADIPLVTNAAGASLLTAQLPVGFGLESSGPAGPVSAAASLANLVSEIRTHTVDGSADQAKPSTAEMVFHAPMAIRPEPRMNSRGDEPCSPPRIGIALENNRGPVKRIDWTLSTGAGRFYSWRQQFRRLK